MRVLLFGRPCSPPPGPHLGAQGVRSGISGLPRAPLGRAPKRFVVREALFTTPWTPSGRPGGCDQEFRASRGPPWAVHPIQKGPPGRPSARPEVAPEGLGAIFELLKKRWFLCYFEPSDRSSGVKGAKKRAKMEDQDAPRGQTPGIKAK